MLRRQRNVAEIWFPRAVCDEILSLAADADSVETCGFLLGARETSSIDVWLVIAVRNASRQIGAFSICDYEVDRVRRVAERAGCEMVALFHTHPSGSLRLSPQDLIGVTRSSIPWVIVIPAGDSCAEPHQLVAAYGPPHGARIDVFIHNCQVVGGQNVCFFCLNLMLQLEVQCRLMAHFPRPMARSKTS